MHGDLKRESLGMIDDVRIAKPKKLGVLLKEIRKTNGWRTQAEAVENLGKREKPTANGNEYYSQGQWSKLEKGLRPQISSALFKLIWNLTASKPRWRRRMKTATFGRDAGQLLRLYNAWLDNEIEWFKQQETYGLVEDQLKEMWNDRVCRAQLSRLKTWAKKKRWDVESKRLELAFLRIAQPLVNFNWIEPQWSELKGLEEYLYHAVEREKALLAVVPSDQIVAAQCRMDEFQSYGQLVDELPVSERKASREKR